MISLVDQEGYMRANLFMCLVNIISMYLEIYYPSPLSSMEQFCSPPSYSVLHDFGQLLCCTLFLYLLSIARLH